MSDRTYKFERFKRVFIVRKAKKTQLEFSENGNNFEPISNFQLSVIRGDGISWVIQCDKSRHLHTTINERAKEKFRRYCGKDLMRYFNIKNYQMRGIVYNRIGF